MLKPMELSTTTKSTTPSDDSTNQPQTESKPTSMTRQHMKQRQCLNHPSLKISSTRNKHRKQNKEPKIVDNTTNPTEAISANSQPYNQSQDYKAISQLKYTSQEDLTPSPNPKLLEMTPKLFKSRKLPQEMPITSTKNNESSVAEQLLSELCNQRESIKDNQNIKHMDHALAMLISFTNQLLDHIKTEPWTTTTSTVQLTDLQWIIDKETTITMNQTQNILIIDRTTTKTMKTTTVKYENKTTDRIRKLSDFFNYVLSNQQRQDVQEGKCIFCRQEGHRSTSCPTRTITSMKERNTKAFKDNNPPYWFNEQTQQKKNLSTTPTTKPQILLRRSKRLMDLQELKGLSSKGKT
jgi:hypothetical protein